MKNKKSQNMLSYSVIIAVLAIVFLAMATYAKRAIQGKYRQAADVFGGGEQYE